MRTSALIAMWGATVCAAFGVGVCIGKPRRPLSDQPHPAAETASRKSAPDRALLASVENSRNALSERERIASSLKAEIAGVWAKLSPLSPKEEKWRKEWEEERATRKLYDAIREREKELIRRILQRKDKALRVAAFDEVASLLQSERREDVLLGVLTLLGVFPGGIEFDKERFKPQVLAALGHGDLEVRYYALQYLGWAYMGQEAAEIALSVVNDPDPRIRCEALERVAWFGGKDRREETASALKTLLQDKNGENRSWALSLVDRLRYAPSFTAEPVAQAYDYYEEMEELVVDVSKDPESTRRVLEFWCGREKLGKDAIQRFTEILEQPYDESQGSVLPYVPHWQELRPLAYRYYLRTLREALEYQPRSESLRILGDTRDKSLLPELEAIAQTGDAEGIEQELADTINRLRRFGEDGK